MTPNKPELRRLAETAIKMPCEFTFEAKEKFIAAASPQTVLSLLDEIHLLRRELGWGIAVLENHELNDDEKAVLLAMKTALKQEK